MSPIPRSRAVDPRSWLVPASVVGVLIMGAVYAGWYAKSIVDETHINSAMVDLHSKQIAEDRTDIRKLVGDVEHIKGQMDDVHAVLFPKRAEIPPTPVQETK